ncbi:hypothetical protein SAVCW2_14970 [Streptomyces avermitilis]|uniref:hypothetical protein n=1 Tax=Streptomyces avermitilis TaxID=33903 RepID=UPI0010D690D8|nr:hypothetical protein [Streptomyces avermitilis]GDY82298.1 hypothetical protein SAVCW2_14970 [Streptomyces avermitilis]
MTDRTDFHTAEGFEPEDVPVDEAGFDRSAAGFDAEPCRAGSAEAEPSGVVCAARSLDRPLLAPG